MSNSTPYRRSFSYIRNVAEHHRRRTPNRDHSFPDVARIPRAADSANSPFHGTLSHKPARCVDVGSFHRVNYFVEGDSARRHAVGIQLNLELAKISSQSLDRRYTGDGQKPVTDIELAQIAQRHEINRAGFRLQGELKDFVEPSRQAGNERGVGSRGQLRSRLAHTFRHELARAVVVCVGFKLNGDLCNSQLRVRTDSSDFRQTSKRGFHWDSNASFKFLSAHRTILNDDVEDGGRKVRKHVSPQVGQPHCSESRASQNKKERQPSFGKRCLEYVSQRS